MWNFPMTTVEFNRLTHCAVFIHRLDHHVTRTISDMGGKSTEEKLWCIKIESGAARLLKAEKKLTTLTR